MLRFIKGSDTYYYKTSYKEDTWVSVPVRITVTRKSKGKIQENVTLHPAYDSKIEVSENKKRDLKSSLQTNIIPKFYETFFNTLF